MEEAFERFFAETIGAAWHFAIASLGSSKAAQASLVAAYTREPLPQFSERPLSEQHLRAVRRVAAEAKHLIASENPEAFAVPHVQGHHTDAADNAAEEGASAFVPTGEQCAAYFAGLSPAVRLIACLYGCERLRPMPIAELLCISPDAVEYLLGKAAAAAEEILGSALRGEPAVEAFGRVLRTERYESLPSEAEVEAIHEQITQIIKQKDVAPASEDTDSPFTVLSQPDPPRFDRRFLLRVGGFSLLAVLVLLFLFIAVPKLNANLQQPVTTIPSYSFPEYTTKPQGESFVVQSVTTTAATTVVYWGNTELVPTLPSLSDYQNAEPITPEPLTTAETTTEAPQETTTERFTFTDPPTTLPPPTETTTQNASETTTALNFFWPWG
ncbi:MAG: hypothetical protein LBR73_05435 [Oscillospiraceae bacterium]|jgi:DNA-directed RNA polymerase specialized sigma24 family protein|nr:hypothetical protein [Oscillospiraceae bacterium]